MNYYIVRDGEAVGPFSEEGLAGLARSGDLTGDTLVWCEGMADWTVASHVPDLEPVLPGRSIPTEADGGDEEAPPAGESPRESDEDAEAEAHAEPAEEPAPSAAEPVVEARPVERETPRRQTRLHHAAPPRWVLPYARRPGTVPYRIDDGLREGWNAWKAHPLRAVVALILFAILLALTLALPVTGAVVTPLETMLGIQPSIATFDGNAFPDSPVGQVRMQVAWLIHLATTSPVGMALMAASVILFAILFTGLMAFHLRHVRGDRVSAFGVLSGFRRPISAVLAMILTKILVMAGLLLFVVPGVYLAVRFMFVPMAVVDQRLGPLSAIRASWRAVGALGWWQCFGTALSSLLIGLFGLVWFLVGGLVTIPVALAAIGAAYDTALANDRGR